MKKIISFYKSSIFSYLIDPLFYASSLITILFVAFRFFYAGKFFVANVGSTDLRPFFTAFPYISILTLPLLAFRLKRFILDDSLPLFPFKRFFCLVLAAFSSFCLPVLLLVPLPLCVSFFGNVDFGQCFTGFLGILFYGFSALSLTIFFFSLFAAYTALPLILSALLLSVTNFIHLLPLYVRTGNFLSSFSKSLSFAWHFDSFGKGILDSRNIFYYIAVSFLLILLSVFFEYRRIGKKTSRATLLLFLGIFIFLSLGVKNLYFRIDLTESKQFSLSETSKSLLENLEGELRITYFRSSELKNLYPQSSDVAEFLSDYASENGNISFVIEKADVEKLKKLGLQGQQIRSDNGTKTEFVTVFSAVLLQYLEKSELIPFVLSTNTLEYDLTEKVQKLVTDRERKVYLLCGNGRSVEESYAYVYPWLSSRGFSPEILNDFNATEVLKNLGAEDEICIFGTKDFTREQSFYIESAIERGCRAFFAASPYHTTIEDEWKITKNKDELISYLNGKGFAFENALVEDISCYPLTMESGDGNSSEYVTVNYPLWPVLQNQKNARNGVTVFWASPISLYGQAEPLLYTTNLAWRQEPSDDESNLFLTNPFLLPKSASASGSESSQFVVAARNGSISLVSDQFFLSSLLTGFISGEEGGDFRNYDYLSRELLILRGEEELAYLMEKASPVTSLYKIIDEEEFNFYRFLTLFICFGLLPLFMVALNVFLTIRRHRLCLREGKE